MLTSFHTQSLAESFRTSSRFYYMVIDRAGTLVYVNPLFQQHFHHIAADLTGKEANAVFSPASGDQLYNAVQHCLQNGDHNQQVDLYLPFPDGTDHKTKWEFFISDNNEGAAGMIHAIGFSEEQGNIVMGEGHRAGELAERYKAYQHSAEALWRFEFREPVSASATPDEIIAHCRIHGFMAECNDNMARMYGFEKAEELTGSNMSDLMDLNDPVWVQNMKSFIGNGFKSTKVETREHDRYGNTLYFVNSMEGIVENGSLRRVWGTQQDVTEQKKATEQISYLARLVDTVSDIIISQDKDFNVLSWNKAAEISYGYTASEVIGKKVKEVLHFEYEGISRARFFELIEENGEWHGESYVVNRHGRSITLLTSVTRIQNAKGETTGYVSVSKDITEKRKMEDQLQESELFYRNLFVSSLDGILITDERGIIRFASSSITPVLGYSDTELMEKSIFNYVYIDDRPDALAAFMDELNGNLEKKFISLRLLKKNGEYLWCFVRGHNQMDNPHVKGVIIYLHDDTMRRESEAALMESEQRFRYQATVLNNVTDVIITTDTKGIVTSWNKVVEKISGITETEAIGKLALNSLEIDHSPFTPEQVGAIVMKEGVWRGELAFKRKDGVVTYLLHTISLMNNDKGHFIGFLGVGKDITERKKAEKSLQESEQFYRSLSYHSFDGIIMADKTGKIAYCGPSVPKISGYGPPDLLGRNFFEFIHPDDRMAATKAFVNEVNKQSVVSFLFLRLKHLNGHWVWCTVRAHNLLDTPGINSIVIYFTNDTRRKEAEDKLRRSEERFRNLVHNLKQGVIVQAKGGEITICNQAALDMFSLSRGDLEGKNILDIPWNVIREDGSFFPIEEYPLISVEKNLRPVKDVVMGVYRAGMKDRIWLLVNSDPLLDNDGELLSVICSITDITEQKRLTKELFDQEVQKQKLLVQATIDGQETERQQMGKELHDNINQHLTTTRLYLEVAREKAEGEVLEMINLSHKNLAGIIYEIRQLSQSLVPPTLGDIGLTESIEDLCESLNRAHPFNIDFYHPYFNEEEIPENVKLMLYRITQEQVSNIIRHAHAANLNIKLQSDAEYIFLTISDDGIGFDPAHYKKGMGFSNIITRAGLFNGKVEIDTAPGKGCQLSIIIPLEGIAEDMN